MKKLTCNKGYAGLVLTFWVTLAVASVVSVSTAKIYRPTAAIAKCQDRYQMTKDECAVAVSALTDAQIIEEYYEDKEMPAIVNWKDTNGTVAYANNEGNIISDGNNGFNVGY